MKLKKLAACVAAVALIFTALQMPYSAGRQVWAEEADFIIDENGTLRNYRGHSEKVIIPGSVTSIGAFAFADCILLESIEIPNSVTSIGECAFSGCTSLKSITISASVATIENSAFSACHRLTSITVDEGNTIYDSRNNCNALIETASNTLILGCQNTVIPDGVTTIGAGAFYCSNLTDIKIPDGVTTIGEGAFGGCNKLINITIPDSVTTIGAGAFEYCDLRSIELPNSVTSIGAYAFFYCSHLPDIKIPDGVTSIGSRAFKGCSGAKFAVIPDSVTMIGENAFEDGKLVIYGKSGSCAQDYANTSKFTFKELADTSSDELIITKDGELIKYYGKGGDVVLPDSITMIKKDAFSECEGLTDITIPDSVTTIGERAFYGCSGLTDITIPGSVTTIEKDAFCMCSGLTDVTILDGLTTIEIDAFSGCKELKKLTIPASVTSINRHLGGSSELVIYGKSGSYAEDFANSNGITFKDSADVPDKEGMHGDLNSNNKVDLSDAQLALKAALNLTILTAEQIAAADVNGNGQVDLADAQMILKAALNLIELS